VFNASPDIREQLGRLPANGSPSALRHVPIEGVLLTDAEIDHSLGIILLREAGFLRLYTTSAIQSVLTNDSRILSVARAFADLPCTELPLDTEVELLYRDGTPSGLSVEAFEVPAGPPQFAQGAATGHTVGLFVRESKTGRACAFAPGCGDLTSPLLDRFAHADILLFDGTFWSDDELVALGIGKRTARAMDHVPISGPGGSLEQLSALPCRHRVYTHINNTNPVLLERSPERAAVTRAGLTVGYDGLRLTV
jgi:pyrroloquinoline quinone biosynthesis protein B